MVWSCPAILSWPCPWNPIPMLFSTIDDVAPCIDRRRPWDVPDADTVFVGPASLYVPQRHRPPERMLWTDGTGGVRPGIVVPLKPDPSAWRIDSEYIVAADTDDAGPDVDAGHPTTTATIQPVITPMVTGHSATALMIAAHMATANETSARPMQSQIAVIASTPERGMDGRATGLLAPRGVCARARIQRVGHREMQAMCRGCRCGMCGRTVALARQPAHRCRDAPCRGATTRRVCSSDLSRSRCARERADQADQSFGVHHPILSPTRAADSGRLSLRYRHRCRPCDLAHRPATPRKGCMGHSQRGTHAPAQSLAAECRTSYGDWAARCWLRCIRQDHHQRRSHRSDRACAPAPTCADAIQATRRQWGCKSAGILVARAPSEGKRGQYYPFRRRARRNDSSLTPVQFSALQVVMHRDQRLDGVLQQRPRRPYPILVVSARIPLRTPNDGLDPVQVGVS